MGCIVKENLLPSSTPEALRGLSEEALGLPVKICSRTSSFHGLHAGFGWEESYLGVGNQLRQSTLVIQTSSFLLANRVGGAIFFGDAMKKQTQVFQSLAIGLLVLGMAVVGSRLNAQQTSSSPVDTRAQAQEPQGQQPAQQPGQEYPAGQQSQQPQQPAPSAQQPGQPGAQAGQPQGVQTFTGMIVKSGDKYVLQDSATGTTYDIDHQDEVSKHVGRKVQVTGTLDPNGKMIHLQPSER